ncbi:MAG TPA: YciI family protein [Candidatus Dormibacteraeota bacterium]|nr:YciI family protein [Candidatus Dormibacteraeota bacterium]
MKYLYLLYADEAKMPAPGSPEFHAQNDAYNKYYEELSGPGLFKAGDPVMPSQTSKTVRMRNSATKADSGPFSHGGDQVIGFYVIEAKDMDEAVAYAAKCPAASAGAVEVRPIVQM